MLRLKKIKKIVIPVTFAKLSSKENTKIMENYCLSLQGISIDEDKLK